MILPARQAAAELHEALENVVPIDVRFGCVDKFESTQVVKLTLDDGAEAFTRLHDQLNAGALQFPDQYLYVPHVTIGHELPSSLIDAALHEACTQWDRWSEDDRAATIDTLTLVQQAADGHWVDLEDYRLKVPVPQPVPVRRYR